MLGVIIQVLISGFIIGGLARWAVPGPDPMPVWMTILLGVLGSAIGGSIAAALFGTSVDSGTAFSALLFSILAASLLVIAYRRYVQHRPITGPDAYRSPAPSQQSKRLRDVFSSPAKRAHEREEVDERLRKLSELHDDGVLTDEEYERKKAELLARM